MIYLLPQIQDFTANKLIDLFIEKSSVGKLNPEYKERFYTATGGQRIPIDYLLDLRRSILNCANKYNFPNKQKSFLDFEYEVAEIFFNWPYLWIDQNNKEPNGEALRNNFWSYITIILMPDIAVWRWPIPSENASKKSWEVRMKGGGTRNTFQRIFRRLISFDKGKEYQLHERLNLIKGLNEDEFQAIIERTNVSSCSKLSILLAEEIISRKKLNMQTDNLKQDIYRKSIIDLTAYGKVQSFDLLEDIELKELIAKVFELKESEILELKNL